MPKYVLHYFQFKGMGEHIRLILHHLGIEFEDHRIHRTEEWPKFKTQNDKLLPFGQVPILEIDGVVMAQTFAITRFLANEFGLNGNTNMEKAKNDMLIDGILDVSRESVPFFRETDPTRKAAMKYDYFENQLPKVLQIYEDKFMPEKGFFLGDSVSLADIHFHASMDWLFDFKSDILDKFPKAKALYRRIGNTPNIKKYLETRKKESDW